MTKVGERLITIDSSTFFVGCFDWVA